MILLLFILIAFVISLLFSKNTKEEIMICPSVRCGPVFGYTGKDATSCPFIMTPLKTYSYCKDMCEKQSRGVEDCIRYCQTIYYP